MPASSREQRVLAGQDGHGTDKKNMNAHPKGQEERVPAGTKEAVAPRPNDDLHEISIGPEELDNSTGTKYIPDLQVRIYLPRAVSSRLT
jgi:hypothetical protein